MSYRVVVISGVGTSIGKTHLAAALATTWGKTAHILAYKPVETGVQASMGEDEAVLASVSTFHVKQSPLQWRLRTGVAPRLAARIEGRSIELEDIAREVARLRLLTDLIVELPGGLFSPLSSDTLNADLVPLLRPDRTLLVAPDRLGVLHDVIAVFLACANRALDLSCVVLTPPLHPDLSTGTNAAELRAYPVPVLDTVPRASIASLAEDPGVQRLVALCRGQE